jgi:hypothetical protein
VVKNTNYGVKSRKTSRGQDKRCANAQEISLCAMLHFVTFNMMNGDWAFLQKKREDPPGTEKLSPPFPGGLY